MGFPGGSNGKESTCNTGDLGSIPRLERFHVEKRAPSYHTSAQNLSITLRIKSQDLSRELQNLYDLLPSPTAATIFISTPSHSPPCFLHPSIRNSRTCPLCPHSLTHLSGALCSQTSVLDLFSCRSLLYFLMICLSHQNETPREQGPFVPCSLLRFCVLGQFLCLSNKRYTHR